MHPYNSPKDASFNMHITVSNIGRARQSLEAPLGCGHQNRETI